MFEYCQEIRNYVSTYYGDNVYGNTGSAYSEYLYYDSATNLKALCTCEYDVNYNFLNWEADAWCSSWSPTKFIALISGCSNYSTAEDYVDHAIDENVGYVYVNDDTGADGSDWNSLPTWFEDIVDYILEG